MSWWLLNAIDKLDGQPYGGNLKAYLEGTGEGARFAEEFGPQRWAIWNDSSLTWDAKSAQLEKAGLDVSTIIAMAILGGVTGGPKPLGLGSTGRTAPNSLNEKLAMQQAMSNPAAGTIVPLRKSMTDSRWPATNGWVKMTQNVNGIEIHYVRNTRTGDVDDFKFK